MTSCNESLLFEALNPSNVILAFNNKSSDSSARLRAACCPNTEKIKDLADENLAHLALGVGGALDDLNRR